MASIELPQLADEKSVSANPPPPVELPPLLVESAAKLLIKWKVLEVQINMIKKKISITKSAL